MAFLCLKGAFSLFIEFVKKTHPHSLNMLKEQTLSKTLLFKNGQYVPAEEMSGSPAVASSEDFPPRNRSGGKCAASKQTPMT
jgi:hypothetical protein